MGGRDKPGGLRSAEHLAEAERAAYQQPTEAVVAALDSDAERGLTAVEARRRLEQYGPNELQAEAPIPAWRKFLAQFQDVLVILLLIAAAISTGLWLYQRDEALPYDGIVIFAIVLLNGILGYVQEARAEHSVAALRAMAAADATVIRDGQPERVPAVEVVPGDVVRIEEGNTIPADGRLIRSVALRTAEASLTGESLPVSKDTDLIADEVGIGDRGNTVFSGTAVVSGHGRAVVTATGMRTEMGKIAGLLRQTGNQITPLQQELDRTGKRLGLLVLGIAAVMVVTILLVEQVREPAAIVEVLILGVALAVAAVPEGLTAVVTAVLAMGVNRMAQRRAIIRQLPAVETLGSATVIASDKTGTLTRN
jgi:Ca2+-transporting ATPase